MKSGNSDGIGESDGGRLLEEIEAISKALYLNKGQTNSISESHLAESSSRFNQGYPQEEALLINETDKKSSSTWNWKKSLKALTHIRHRKFNCVFYLKVHSIEGLPLSFNGYSLSVHWKRKDEILRTRPSKVFQGVAEFDETLIHKGSISSGRSLANHSAKYDPKLFVIYVSMLGAPRLDFGKHSVDLTRILPLTLEELEGDKCSGNWSTSFRLAGNARGASLNVSFSFLVTKDDPMKLSGPENVVQLLKLLHYRSRLSAYGAPLTSTNLNGLPSRDGNISHGLNYGSVTSTQFDDTETSNEQNQKLELANSINVLYGKMDEADQHKSDLSGSEFAEQFEVKSNEENKSDEAIGGGCYDDSEFYIIDCGIELAGTEEHSLDKITVQTIEGSKIETVSLDEIIDEDKVAIECTSRNMSKNAVCDIHVDDSTRDDFKYEQNNLELKVEEVAPEELSSDSDFKCILPSVETTPGNVGELLEQENDMDAKEICARKSLSPDDSYDSVVSEFIKELGLEHGSARFSDPDVSSPRERLLREFEQESLIFGNSLLDFMDMEEWQDYGSVDMLESTSWNYNENFEFSIRVAEGHEGHQSLIQRRKAELLVDLETDALMEEGGLNERDFEPSPHYCLSGFGSPIELPQEKEPPKLPSLEEGFGGFLKLDSGGFLRSMSPWLLQNTSFGQSLVIQCSDPVVLPAEMGHNIMDISQHLALAGTKNLSMLAKKLMPLDEISGKTIQQMISECPPSTTLLEREPMLESNLSCCLELPSYPNDNLRSLLDSKMHLDLVSPDDLAFLALEKIETLLIEGLRIQSGFSGDDTPAQISAHPFHRVSASGQRRPNFDGSCSLEGLKELQFMNRPESASDIVGLMDLSITLENWLRLDAGNINDDDDQNGQHIMKTLVAHGANYADIVARLSKDIKSKEMGLFKNKLVVALMVQLRDNLRDYESVGGPMMCIMEVERFYIDTACGTASEMSSVTKENEPLQAQEDMHETNQDEDQADKEHIVHAFKISDIHLLGVNSEPNKMQFWQTTVQQQSGSRWLLSSGMGRNFKLPISKSKEIVSFSSFRAKAFPGDILWSISSDIHDEGMISSSTASSSHKRNPDVVIPIQSINPHKRFT